MTDKQNTTASERPLDCVVSRNRPAKNPGGVECIECGNIFIGEPWHQLCAVCDSAMQKAIADNEEELSKPPCWECGAMTAEEAADKCNCGGDKDYCHGCQLWPD